jgi:recombination associated protein RdgC
MGLLKETWTFSRFRVLENLPEQLNALVDGGLKRNAFSDFTDKFSEISLGWTDIENILDTDFTYARYKCGNYLIFSLRMDRRSLSAALLKLKVMEKEKEYLAESSKKRLYRQEREDIKERVRLELLERALPVPSFHEVCWSLSRNTVIFGSHSGKVMEAFQRLFKESFQLTLLPYLPWAPENEESKYPDDRNAEKNVASADPHHVNAVEPSHMPFTGREFLTWLWFKSEERNGIITVPDMGENEVIFLQRLVLASGDGEYSETVVCQGLHADMQEGKEALRRGKKIKEARLKVVKDETKWEFTFKADMFQFQSLKLPAIMELEEEMDREGRNLERIYLVERIIDTMDRLFTAFLQIRNSSQWKEDELPRMGKWVNELN